MAEPIVRWLLLTRAYAVKDKDGKPAEHFIESQQIDTPQGPRTVDVYARRGCAGIRELKEDGDPHFVKLERIKTERRFGANSWRFYNVYRLPESYGGGKLRLRLHGNPEDTERGLNRAEHLRAIGEDHPDFRELFAWRNDAENVNSIFKRSLPGGRARSVGAFAQEVDLYGFVRLHNALVRHRHRKRQALPLAA